MDTRKFLDAALAILFLLTMSFYFLPRILHEIFGLVTAVAVVVHIFINRRRFLSMVKSRKFFSTAINFSLIAIFLVILVTGIFLSNFIFRDLIPMELRRNMTVHQLHVALPYLATILIGLHAGLHWRELREKFFRPIKNTLLEKIFLAVIIFAGVYGSFLNRVGDRILMKHIFATPATEFSLPIFLFLMFATAGLYSAIIIIFDALKAKK